MYETFKFSAGTVFGRQASYTQNDSRIATTCRQIAQTSLLELTVATHLCGVSNNREEECATLELVGWPNYFNLTVYPFHCWRNGQHQIRKGALEFPIPIHAYLAASIFAYLQTISGMSLERLALNGGHFLAIDS